MNRLFTAFFLPFFFISLHSASAQNHDKHFVYFKDKANSPYSFSKPEQFLSQAALKRRQKQKIALNQRDLPVNPIYVTSLKALGVEVRYKSKWLNGAVIVCDSAKLMQVLTLPFVKSGQTLNREIPGKSGEEPDPIEELIPVSNVRKTADPAQYGESFTQAEMIGATQMHDAGFHGEGMTVGVFDNGFPGVDRTMPFAHLYQNNQVKGVYNFVTNNRNVYSRGGHGTSTLSNIAAYHPGKFIGTAYKANVYLFVTEDDNGEYPIEEANWLIAAEFADSAGVDVINSSLGYSTFDDSRYNYTYADMNGNTTIVTRAADFAASTGMLVVSSAGNEGNDPWLYITAPADGDSVLTVGAVDAMTNKAGFSSFGPASDGRIKPNLAAMGVQAAVVNSFGDVGKSNGTSFSGPILAGMATAFWQANPHLTNMQVIQYLQRSATQANNPDNNLGYGIPNFAKAQELVSKDFGLVNTLTLFPNPTNATLINLGFEDLPYAGPVDVKIFDRTGRLVVQHTLQREIGKRMEFTLPSHMKAGLYIVQVAWSDKVETLKFMKLP
ncbi:S8 family serine peptidase [Adhaeribacter sp. BT258]|uniref:S8 family serine peptidase n=1 Tax=Adhaeribacter terrigena TaxID=2793070 RepID=A0ABS1C2L6_9BACT|nr:S8 family serine peptidase [Adhaeribacter terrigena]MBK0402888.1 S8 family serine peptidase [Adhaeribacter terrigena]